jgi:uncharacterized protein YyaL (SSP411 family)
MLDPAGVQMLRTQHLPFYSTQDADGEGEEGKFFVWTVDEIREVLTDDADSFVAARGVTRHGNTSTGIARLYDTSDDHTPGGGMMAQYPLGFGQWLQALSYALSKARETAIIGDPDSVDTQALLGVARGGYRPFQVVAFGAPGRGASTVPLLDDRELVDGQPAAYVCQAFACQAPVTTPEALGRLLCVN